MGGKEEQREDVLSRMMKRRKVTPESSKSSLGASRSQPAQIPAKRRKGIRGVDPPKGDARAAKTVFFSKYIIRERESATMSSNKPPCQ